MWLRGRAEPRSRWLKRASSFASAHTSARAFGDDQSADGEFTIAFHYRQRSLDVAGHAYSEWNLPGELRRGPPEWSRFVDLCAALVHVHGSRDVVSAYACGAQVSTDFWAACREVAARADARGAAANAASKLARAGAGALDRATLKRHASHFLRRPLARWAPALTEVLRRRSVPWHDVLTVVAKARNVKLASTEGRRPSYTVPLITRNEACVAALVVVTATADWGVLLRLLSPIPRTALGWFGTISWWTLDR